MFLFYFVSLENMPSREIFFLNGEFGFVGFAMCSVAYVVIIDVSDVVSSKNIADENTIFASNCVNSECGVNGLNRMIRKKHT